MKMARTILFFLLVISSVKLNAQIYDPVKWQFQYEHLGADDYVLIFSAAIEEGWAVYSQYLESDEGPSPTSVTFDEDGTFELIGKCEESGDRKEGFDPIFEMNVVKYYNTLQLRQKITIHEPTTITGYVNFMTCDDTKCLPPTDAEFSLRPEPIKLPDESSKQMKDLDGGGENPLEDAEDVVESKKDKSLDQLDYATDVFSDLKKSESEFQPADNDGILQPVRWNASLVDPSAGQIVFNAEIR